MKYPLYLIPNQSGHNVVLQAKRETFAEIERDFASSASHKRVLLSAMRQYRESKAEIIRITLTREEATSLLQLVGQSY